MTLYEQLEKKILTLNNSVWEHRVPGPRLKEWLDNFRPDSPGGPSERLHALFLLGQFMYFGSREMRVLLRSLYRDVFRHPIVARIRQTNADTLDSALIEREFQLELKATRFLGVGNPAESGVHLLYYFRQENGLPRSAFIHTHELFSRTAAMTLTIRDATVKNYIFIDDFCGSGQQAILYSKQLVEALKQLVPQCRVEYYALFGLKKGIDFVRSNTAFDRAVALAELGETFRCFTPGARCFVSAPAEITPGVAERLCRDWGSQLAPGAPLGYDDCQLLIGFFHNTPDNTLPIIWKDNVRPPWVAVFHRYHKKYNWAGI